MTAEIQKKIEQLKKKISSKETAVEKLKQKMTDTKSDIRALKRDIEDLRLEIRQLDLEQLSETLTENGFTSADVAAAIAAGGIKKIQTYEPPSDNDRQADGDKADTYSTISDNKEVTDNEVSDSGKALGSA